MGDGGSALGAVTPRHSFGPRGGARCVEHDRPCVGIGAWRRVHRSPGNQVVKSLRPLQTAFTTPNKDEWEPSKISGAGGGLDRDVLVDYGTRFRILDAEIEFVGLGAPIHRSDDDAGELAGPMHG